MWSFKESKLEKELNDIKVQLNEKSSELISCAAHITSLNYKNQDLKDKIDILIKQNNKLFNENSILTIKNNSLQKAIIRKRIRTT